MKDHQPLDGKSTTSGGRISSDFIWWEKISNRRSGWGKEKLLPFLSTAICSVKPEFRALALLFKFFSKMRF
jgi:hypothetical protein